VIDSSTDWSNKTEILRGIVEEVERINGTVSRALSLSRPQPPALTDLDVKDTLCHVFRVTRAHFKHLRLELVEPTGDAPLPVWGDASQLQQVLLNVLLNASQATPAGGRVTVSTEEIVTEGEPQVVVRITDTGSGVRPEDRGRIFEPFFTTKALGTGLGLSICRRFMGDHGGTIEIDEAAGGGTVVTLSLPRRVT
jgi:signal transduction histidine kinase